MSVVAGRVFLAISGVLIVGCAVWFVLAVWATSTWVTSVAVAPVAIGLIALVALCAGAPLFSRFVEAEVVSPGEAAVAIRSVLRPLRILPLADIESAVVLEGLVLPARAAVPAVSRVVIRLRGGSVVAFTPRDERFLRDLRAHGLAVTVDPEPLSPARAARRYPGSVGLGELASGALPWAAIAVGAAAILWVVAEAVSG